MSTNTPKQTTQHHWPKTERPREKLLTLGASALTDSELLAIFLQTGNKKKPVLQLAQELLEKFGSISNLLHASSEQMCDINGIGPAKCVMLKANLELAQRYLNDQATHRIAIKDAKTLENFLTLKLKQESREVFACLFLDPKLKLIKYDALFYGSLTQVSVHPREIARLALHYNADSIILAHNHPFGNADPSTADIALTEIIKSALGLLDIRVIDHIIIGESDAYSFALHGKI